MKVCFQCGDRWEAEDLGGAETMTDAGGALFHRRRVGPEGRALEFIWCGPVEDEEEPDAGH